MAEQWWKGEKASSPQHPPQGSLHRTAPRASLQGQASVTGNQAQEEFIIRATCDANRVLGLLARCQALARGRGGDTRLRPCPAGTDPRSHQAGGQPRWAWLPQPREEGSSLLTISPLPFPAPTSGPVLVLYYDHQAGSWFSSYRFSFSFSKLLALVRT